MLYKRGSIGLFFRGDPTLKAWWSFDNVLTQDLSNNNYHLTDETANGGTAPTPTVGLLPNYRGVRFNGINQCYKNTSLTNYGRSLTLMCWIQPTVVPSTQVWLVGQNGASQLVIRSNGKVAFLSYLNSTWVYIEDPNVVDINQPSFYVATDNGTTFRLYKNGILVASANITGTYNNNSNSTCIGGYYSGGWYQMYNGKMNEVAIFFRALSAQEIFQYYKWATKPISKLAALLLGAVITIEQSVIALLTKLEKQQQFTTALQSQLEKIVYNTTALSTILQYAGYTTTALYTQLETSLKDLIALQTTLEKTTTNNTAIIAQLEKKLQDILAITATLRAKIWRREPYHDNQVWIEELKH